MKLLTLLLLFATTSVYANTFESLKQQVDAAKTLQAVAEAEEAIAAATLIDSEMSFLAGRLFHQYRHAKLPAFSAADVIAKYTPNFNTSTDLMVLRYWQAKAGDPARIAFQAALKNVASVQEFDTLVDSYFSTNQYPSYLNAAGIHSITDEQPHSMAYILADLATTANRVNHPEAVNYALAHYRYIPINNNIELDRAVAGVASALKSKDFSLARANTWLSNQNTGTESVAFTKEELETPDNLALVNSDLTKNTTTAFEKALTEYRVAGTSRLLDIAIYNIANVFKAHDLNLVRANAWIEAQKNGTEFDLTLE